MSIFDIRTNKIIHMASLHNEEVTSATMNQNQDSLVVGFKDGVVKIFNLDGKDYENRESYNMFPSSGGNKKHAVS
jgi:hypothetical protein